MWGAKSFTEALSSQFRVKIANVATYNFKKILTEQN